MMIEKAFSIRVLGRHAPYPSMKGACSGYLLTLGSQRILLDCGNGVVSRLQEYLSLAKLTAVLISHYHEDHVADLTALRHAYEDAQRWGGSQRSIIGLLPQKPARTS